MQMQSKLFQAIGFKHEAVAVILSNEKPEGAKQFKKGKWGCVMFMLASAVRGNTAVFDRETFGCFGGGTGLGFGNQYKNFPGGEECFCYFLSTGNENWEKGRQVAEQAKPYMRKETLDDFLFGERYLKTPQQVQSFIQELPITDIPYDFVIFKPLSEVDLQRETPEVIVFLGDMDQISALTVLANFHRDDNQNVIFPYAAGCMSICIYPFQEANSERPRAILGLNDISARVALKRVLKDDLMTFAVPLKLFQEMEENVEQSFLYRNTWRELMQLGKEA